MRVIFNRRGAPRWPWARRPEPTAELLVKQFHRTLSDVQRGELCFSWDHRDERGLLRSFVANHWQVTRPCIRSPFFSAGQQAAIHDIFRSLVDPAWYLRFMRQLADDTKGHPWGQDQSIAVIGDPATGPYQFLFTGRHLTLRADGGSAPDLAFGGPIVYGHAADGQYREPPMHPGNLFWPQALAATRLHDMLGGAERERAVVERLPAEWDIGFGRAPAGLPVALLTTPQRAAFDALLDALAAPFRAEDRARLARCLRQQGGAGRLHLAFSAAPRMSAPAWDVWRIEGPAFVWHFQGHPHVHVWVHVAGAPGVAANAHGGAFLHPEHDKLQ